MAYYKHSRIKAAKRFYNIGLRREKIVKKVGATAISITTLSLITLSVKTFRITIHKTHNDTRHNGRSSLCYVDYTEGQLFCHIQALYAECHYAECHYADVNILNVIMLMLIC